MRRRRLIFLKPFSVATLTILLMGALLCPLAVHAQTLSQYTTTLPFVTNAVAPSILLVLDNSGSMQFLASESGLPPFDPAATYNGVFDPTKCYQYKTGGVELFRTGNSYSKSASRECLDPSHPWDGNVLNYVSMRRIDIAKWVLTGGKCDGARNAIDGTCPSGNLVGTSGDPGSGWATRSASIPEALLVNRVDPSVLPGTGTAWFHSPPVAPLTGIFCVDGIPGPMANGTIGAPVGLPVSACSSERQFQVRVTFRTQPTGVIQMTGTRARFGLMAYNYSQGGRIVVDMGDNLGMLTQIDNTIPSGWTPLAETLYEAARYFAQLPPVYNESGPDYTVTRTKDPYYFQPPWVSSPQYVNCCQGYVIIFTDGQPTQDQNIPAGLQNFATSANAHYPTPDHNNVCSAYYGVVGVSDPCRAAGTHYLDDVAYWAHTTDLRQGSVPTGNASPEPGNDLPGMQSLTTYTFFAFGTGSLLLADTAKVGGFDNRDGTGIPNSSVQSCTYPAGSSLGSGASTSSPKWDVNQDCVPDAYFEATSAKDMRDRLLAAVTGILDSSVSSTSVAVVGSSATGEGAVYQAYFFPKVKEGVNELKWLGYTQGLFVDSFGHLREDTNGDGKLVYTDDKIIVPFFDTSSNSVKVKVYSDLNGDGQADLATPDSIVNLTDIKPIWEAGRRLALTNPSARKILTWVDLNNDGNVNVATEQIQFTAATAASVATLCPFLGNVNTSDGSGNDPSVGNCNIGGTDQVAALAAATNIIDFIRGVQVAGLRDRMKTVVDDTNNSVQNVWKLGDVVHSSPAVVGAPRERYDIVYGDASYSAYYQRYQDRRNVIYVGANDGMLHAFNAGFYLSGDDMATVGVVEHGRFDETAPASVTAKYTVSAIPKRGQELWGFIPYQLLPHLQWLTQTDYTHVDYVDLPPKVTDARIFCYPGGPTPCLTGQGATEHPNGWGTILIGGMRFGGSCGTCLDGTGGVAMTVTADFGPGHTGETRTFYSAYFVLDVSNPEQDPVLLWSFSDSALGLTSASPAVLRVNPTSSTPTNNADARWFMVVGSGVTAYDGTSGQAAQIFAIDLATGPKDAGGVDIFSRFGTATVGAMGDAITVDVNLDYRVDVVYIGESVRNGGGPPAFVGKMYRLTMGVCTTAPCDTSIWGVNNAGSRSPTVLIQSFKPGTQQFGPIGNAVAASADENNTIWVYFGTGRNYTSADESNTDTQYFFGVKDPVAAGACTQMTMLNCQQSDLVNVSSAVVCSTCAAGRDQVTGVTDLTTSTFPRTFDGLVGLTLSKDGWYTTLPTNGERSLSRPTILGGIIFFTTFTPQSGDICTSAGDGQLYALYFKTGSAYRDSALGTANSAGSLNVLRSTDLGVGLASQVSLQIGSQGSGTAGTTAPTPGCVNRVTLYAPMGAGNVSTMCVKVSNPWSRMLAWRDL